MIYINMLLIRCLLGVLLDGVIVRTRRDCSQSPNPRRSYIYMYNDIKQKTTNNATGRIISWQRGRTNVPSNLVVKCLTSLSV